MRNDYVFGDDDIRFDKEFIEHGLSFMSKHKIDNLTCSCIRNGETEKNIVPLQWLALAQAVVLATLIVLKILNLAFEFVAAKF